MSPDGRRERITGNIVDAPPAGLDQADRKTRYGWPGRNAEVTVTRDEFGQNNLLAPRRHQTKKADLSWQVRNGKLAATMKYDSITAS